MMAVERSEIVRWMLVGPESGPIIVLVIDDTTDDEFASIVAREDMRPSDNFTGRWGTGELNGNWTIDFHLLEVGGRADRRFFTDNIHRELLDWVLTVPHTVALLPAELAAEARTLEDVVPRLGGALAVGVSQVSQDVARVLAERR
jgi:hypothetical protein